MANKAILTQGGDGTAIPSNMVGEVKRADVLAGTNQVLTAGAGFTDITGASLSLGKGRWMIFAAVGFEGYTSASAGSISILLRNSSDSTDVTSNSQQTVGAGAGGCISIMTFVDLTSTNTYILRASITTGDIGVTGFSRPQFMAVRIA